MLLDSLDREAQQDVDEACGAEIERRCAAIDEGTMATSDWKDVRTGIERNIFGRAAFPQLVRSCHACIRQSVRRVPILQFRILLVYREYSGYL